MRDLEDAGVFNEWYLGKEKPTYKQFRDTIKELTDPDSPMNDEEE